VGGRQDGQRHHLAAKVSWVGTQPWCHHFGHGVPQAILLGQKPASQFHVLVQQLLEVAESDKILLQLVFLLGNGCRQRFDQGLFRGSSGNHAHQVP